MTTTISKKISRLNRTTLNSLNEKNRLSIIQDFTETGIKIAGADFGFAWWKLEEARYELAYKSSKTPYQPNLPRKRGGNYKAQKSGTPIFISKVEKKYYTKKYDISPHMKGYVIIPVSYKNNLYGNIVLCFKQEKRFSQEDKSLCLALGNSAAQAITINRFHHNLENLVEQRTKELTNEIVRRKITEQRLRQAQHMSEQVANVTPGMIAVYNVNTGQYVYVNKAIREILGYSQKDFLSKGVKFVNTLVHPEDLPRIARENQQALKAANLEKSKMDKAIIPFEYRMRHKNGSWRWLNTYGTVFDRNAQGQVEHVLNISVDITERKEMENKLEADSARDQAVLTSLGEGLMATDQQGTIVMVNPQAEEMLGWSKDEMLGKSMFDFQTLIDSHNRPVPLQQRPTYIVLKTGNRVTTNDYCYVKKDGSAIPSSITVTPVRLDGETIGSIQVFRDISKEMEVDRAKSELISLASHQLRTPLSGINWYVEALIKEEVGKLNQQQKKYLNEVYRANQKLVDLVYDFLNVSRLELGTFEVKLSSLDATELADHVINELQPLITQKKLKVEKNYGPNLENIMADRKIVRLLLENLITNAVKYTKNRGRIKVNISLEKTHGKQAQLSISIADNGLGIPKKDQGKIFSKLFRADNVKTLDADGNGLGLYIVKSFAELCGGEIWFKSQEKKGTTFFVKLPLTSAEKHPAALKDSSLSGLGAKK